MSDLRPSRTTAPSSITPGPIRSAVPRSEARRLRIAVVAEIFPRDGRCGTGPLLEHLHRRGHDTLLICPAPRSGTPRSGTLPSSVAGAPVVVVPAMSLRGHPVGLPSRAVMRGLAGFAPDVVHLASPELVGAAALSAAARLGVPTVAVRRTGPGDAPGSLLGRSMARRVLDSDLTLELGPERFSPRRGVAAGRLRREWTAGADALVVGYAGTGPVEVPGTVGVRLDAASAGRSETYAALDLLVVAAPEAPGQTPALMVERALASGVPVIAEAVPGLQELVRPGLDGLTHRPGDADDLARCVHALATDAHRRHWAGMAAASGAERRARERFGDELITRYREVIGARGTG